jgi:hypothetical protein
MDNAIRRAAMTISLVIILFSASTGYAQKRSCTDAESRRALDEAGMLRSWDALYKSYKLYRQCDDGALARATASL